MGRPVRPRSGGPQERSCRSARASRSSRVALRGPGNLSEKLPGTIEGNVLVALVVLDVLHKTGAAQPLLLVARAGEAGSFREELANLEHGCQTRELDRVLLTTDEPLVGVLHNYLAKRAGHY